MMHITGLILNPSVWSVFTATFWLMTYFMNIFHGRQHRGGTLYGHKRLARLTTPLYEVMQQKRTNA